MDIDFFCINGNNSNLSSANSSTCLQFQLFVNELLDVFRRPFEAEHGRVDAQMIGRSSSPRLVAIIVIIAGTFLVSFFQIRFGIALTDVRIGLPNALDAVGHVGRDEDVHTAGMVAQDVVSTTSDEDARLALGQLADDVALNLKKRIVAQVIVIDRAFTDEGDAQPSHERGNEAFVILVGFFKKPLAKSAFLGSQLDELFVIDMDIVHLGQTFADGLTAATQLAAYVNNESFFHTTLVLIVCTKLRKK